MIAANNASSSSYDARISPLDVRVGRADVPADVDAVFAGSSALPTIAFAPSSRRILRLDEPALTTSTRTGSVLSRWRFDT